MHDLVGACRAGVPYLGAFGVEQGGRPSCGGGGGGGAGGVLDLPDACR